MTGNFLRSVFIFLFFIKTVFTYACQCPLTGLNVAECDKYEIIFRGKIVSVTPCDNKFGIATFEVEELYKGITAKQFKVLFECGVECAVGFNEGEEWVIYSKYKQVDKALMDWCSRSRKYFKNVKEDFYAVTYGNEYFDEVKFLRENLGLHRTRKETTTVDANRNQLPNTNQTIILGLCSIVAVLLFYWLFKKYFKF
ncbi:MAG: hypothetical protein ABIP51_06035 [Bacteroidia bacterium]